MKKILLILCLVLMSRFCYGAVDGRNYSLEQMQNQSFIPPNCSTAPTGAFNVSRSTVTVIATDLDIRNLTFSQDKADVSSSTVQAIQSGQWQFGNSTATVIQGTVPWNVSDSTVSALQSGNWSVSVIGVVPVSVVGHDTTTFVTDSMDVTGSTIIVSIPDTISNYAVVLATTPTLISSNVRKTITVYNPVTDYLYCGASDITSSNTVPILQYGTISFDNTASIYGMLYPSTGTIIVIEER